MAEQLVFSDKNSSKEDLYISLSPQIKSLIEGEVDLVANLANVAAALKEAFNFFWVGFLYRKKQSVGFRPISRSNCLYANCLWQRCLRNFMER